MARRSEQTLKQKLMTRDKMGKMYAQLLLVPHRLDDCYGELYDKDEKAVWLMHHFDIPKSQAEILRTYLDMQARKAFTEMDNLYETKKGNWDLKTETKDLDPVFIFEHYEKPARFLNWYLEVLQDAMKELDIKSAGYNFKGDDSAKWDVPNHFYDYFPPSDKTEGKLHHFLFLGAYWLAVAEKQLSDKPHRKNRHSLIASFQLGHVSYSNLKKCIEDGDNTH